MPKNVHLLTFEPWKENSILIRFEQIFAKDEDEKYSQPVSFDLTQDFFHGIDAVSMRETTLSANQWLNEVDRRLQFKFTKKPKEMPSSVEHGGCNDGKQGYTSLKITLSPMEIRTFVINFKLNAKSINFLMK